MFFSNHGIIADFEVGNVHVLVLTQKAVIKYQTIFRKFVQGKLVKDGTEH